MKKLIAEAFGTAVLVFVGCGSVVLAGWGGAMPLGALPIALAFGLSVTAMAYGIGPVSGCHINPAVTAAVWSAGRMPTSDAIQYIIAQIIGGFIGAGILALVLSGKTGGYNIQAGGLGQNVYTNYSTLSAFLCEVIGTMIFTTAILGATHGKTGAGFATGLVIGLTLTLIHILLIPVTGTSVNPARTIAPNIYVGGQALSQLWLFIVAPMVGGVISGFLFRSGLFSSED
ncbi:MAG: aquaporin [Proteobacteria bacterium]|nr:aquaporin [Pseudomonadota bacterium]